MEKIIYAQVLTAKGKTEFSGLCDDRGNEVKEELECDEWGVTLTIWRNSHENEKSDCGISEEEFEDTCAAYSDCDECPLNEVCG